MKTDTLGRVWTPRAKREELVAEYKRSGMSAVAFAKWSGVKYQTFVTWLQKARGERRANEEEAEEAKPMRWAEAVCEEQASECGHAVVIHFGGGVRVEARDGRVAGELLAALGVRAC